MLEGSELLRKGPRIGKDNWRDYHEEYTTCKFRKAKVSRSPRPSSKVVGREVVS